ncbi:Uncharacterised protein [Mycobacteroides abscessus subsp. massiliense]|uniref:hypothetical protein n=1 Tax=Mycobacteroides abscessus TaxID=36809 RepID=UPI0009A7A6B7|nr:hypothetical protein [Mycobacteroides abscessus]SLH43919.1 Uncharacterised protein [Mycobacteroides abscessus subsp. massiliense]
MTTPAPALSTKDVAERFDTDAKTLRVFLRSITYAKNAEGRYSFTSKDVTTLKKRYAQWVNELAIARSKHEARRSEATETTALVGVLDGGSQ